MSNKPVLFAAVLLIFLFACKNSNLETVESRDELGFLERYQRRKTDYAKDGLYEKLYPDGQKKEEVQYVNNLMQGERKLYRENGALDIIETYADGVLNGPFKAFHPNGKIYVEQTYQKGVLEGLSTVYYENGVVREKVMMHNNTENGPFTEYWPNGNIMTEGTYVEMEEGESGEQGELKEYDETGRLIRIADCENGVCRTRWKLEQ